MFLENIIGSKAKVKIVRVLAEVRTVYSLKELAEETRLSLSITHKAAEELVADGALVKIKGTRKERLYRFNSESGFAAALFELFKTEKTRQRKDAILLRTWNLLEQLITRTKENLAMAVLYGSQVRGEATLKSDIDVLIIPRTKAEALLLNKIKKIDKKINPVFMDIKTFISGAKQNDPFYKNIKKEGVVLFIRNEIKKELRESLADWEAFHAG